MRKEICMKTIFQFIFILGILMSIVSCQKKEDDKKGRNLLVLLLLSRPSSLGTGSTELANYFSEGTSLTSEDSTETGGAGATGGVKSYSTTIQNGSGTVNITSEELNCRFGGKIRFEGEQGISVGSRTSAYNFTLNLTSGSRTITYEDCKVSSVLTINSGSITTTQTSTNTTLASQSDSTSVGSKVTRTLSNFTASIKGKLNITIQGRRGSGSGEVEIDQILTLTQRVREWTLMSTGRLGSPNIVSRNGNLKGTVKIGGKSYNVDRSLDFNETSD